LKESENEDIAVECDSYSDENSEGSAVNSDALVVAVSALLVAVSTPYIKRWWNEKAVPVMKRLKNKVTGKSEKIGEKLKTMML